MSEDQEKIKTLEERITQLEATVTALDQRAVNSWMLFQNLFGVKMLPQKGGNVNLMIMVPKKDEGKPGLLADMWLRLNKLWSQYGDSEVILPDLHKEGLN